MKRLSLMLGLAAAMIMTACTPLSAGAGIDPASSPVATTPATAPAVTEPLRSTNIDERTLKLAFDGYDALLYAVDGLIAAKVIVPGSQRAFQVRSALIFARESLNTAAAAQRAGNATTYDAAIADARTAYERAKALLQEIRK